MRAAIVSGAPHTVLDPEDFLGDGFYIIGADRGALTLLEHGIIPHLAVGDFDSVTKAQLGMIRQSCKETILLSPEKDETDTEIALSHALKLQASEIFLYGGLGGRMDHSIANIRLLLRYAKKGALIHLVERQNHLTVLSPGTYPMKRLKHKYLSFFAMERDVFGLTLTGVKYPLIGKTLQQQDTLCISNEVLGETFSIEFLEGYVLMVQSSDC